MALTLLFILVIIKSSTSITLFYDNMDNGAGWTMVDAFAVTTADCVSGGCVKLQTTGYIKRSIDTTGYHSIELKYSIKPSGLEQTDSCEVSYSFDNGNTYNMLATYGYTYNNVLSADVSNFLPTMANDQPNLWIKFAIAGNAQNDNCYIDEVSVFGSIMTFPPTPAPSSNTSSPTSNTPSPTANTISPTSNTQLPTVNTPSPSATANTISPTSNTQLPTVNTPSPSATANTISP
eukprot:513789_1